MVFQNKKFAHRKSEVRKYGEIALLLDSSKLSENRVRHLSYVSRTSRHFTLTNRGLHILKIVMIQTCFYRWFPYRGGGVYQSIETPAWCRSSYYFHSYFYGSPKLGSSLGLQRHSLHRSEHELRHECVHQGWFSNWFGPVGCGDMVHISEVL